MTTLRWQAIAALVVALAACEPGQSPRPEQRAAPAPAAPAPTPAAPARAAPATAAPMPAAPTAARAPAATTAAQPAPRVPPRPTPSDDDHGWNPSQIDWVDYERGMAQSKAQHKPACLIFFTTWCPHCKNYSHVFEDPRVVAEAKKFVMIRVDGDQEKELSARYALDGSYVPRTYFLSPDGEVARDIHAPRPRYLYFYDERDPTSLLAGMQRALQTFD